MVHIHSAFSKTWETLSSVRRRDFGFWVSLCKLRSFFNGVDSKAVLGPIYLFVGKERHMPLDWALHPCRGNSSSYRVKPATMARCGFILAGIKNMRMQATL